MRNVVGEQRGRRTVIEVWITRNYLRGILLLLAPHKQSAIGPARGKRIERRLMRAFVKKFRQRLFLGAPNGDGLAINDL